LGKRNNHDQYRGNAFADEKLQRSVAVLLFECNNLIINILLFKYEK